MLLTLMSTVTNFSKEHYQQWGYDLGRNLKQHNDTSGCYDVHICVSVQIRS